jgi:Ca2+-binding EF-hand superfamily protein
MREEVEMHVFYDNQNVPNINFFLTVKNEDINKLWLVFSAHDREGIGLITRKDFFDKICEEPRTFFGDSMLDFIGKKYAYRYLLLLVLETDNNEVLNFGEFVESICIFSLFEKYDILRCKLTAHVPKHHPHV